MTFCRTGNPLTGSSVKNFTPSCVSGLPSGSPKLKAAQPEGISERKARKTSNRWPSPRNFTLSTAEIFTTPGDGEK